MTDSGKRSSLFDFGKKRGREGERERGREGERERGREGEAGVTYQNVLGLVEDDLVEVCSGEVLKLNGN